MDITFNTLRLYTSEGQIVRAVTQPDGSILFHDFSRMVGGRIAAPYYPLTTKYAFAGHVMHHYDHGTFENEWIFREGMPQRDETMPVIIHRV